MLESKKSQLPDALVGVESQFSWGLVPSMWALLYFAGVQNAKSSGFCPKAIDPRKKSRGPRSQALSLGLPPTPRKIQSFLEYPHASVREAACHGVGLLAQEPLAVL